MSRRAGALVGLVLLSPAAVVSAERLPLKIVRPGLVLLEFVTDQGRITIVTPGL